ncbi:MAG: hypothetical protein HOG49_11930 [Candidatus Scalindua sp.]|jgi:hypothetical protein|nr:hypothetical protein [Candidatus Scalindua sp.]
MLKIMIRLMLSMIYRLGKIPLLRETGALGLLNHLLELLYHLDSIKKNTYKLCKIQYEGIEFEMIGMRTDFDESIKLYGAYEPLLVDKLLKIVSTNDIVFDIGCAEGFFSICASILNKNPRNIHAFDICAPRGRIFKKNFRRIFNMKKDYKQVCVSNVNASNGVEELTINQYVADNDLDVSKIKLIKIDVEGAEEKVLQGMDGSVLGTSDLLIEIHPGAIERRFNGCADTIADLIYGSGYKVELANIRGEHRGGIAFPWRTVQKEEFLAIYKDFVETDPPNFAIHAYK